MLAFRRPDSPKPLSLLQTCAQAIRFRGQRGVTLLELLVSLAIASIFLGATATIVAQSVSSTEAEEAKSLTQSEVNQAISYLQREIDQAVFVYREDQLDAALAAAPSSWQQTADRIPVLGFWRVQRIDEGCIQDLYQSSPADDDAIVGNQILAVGAMYELVVYYWEDNSGSPTWQDQGPARITRRYYRPISSPGGPGCTFAAITLSTTYSNPQPETSADFVGWPLNTAVPAPGGDYFFPADALVAFIDDPTSVEIPPDPDPACPTDPVNYVPAYTTQIKPFYACVSEAIGGNQSSSVYIRIRGNASTDRASGKFDPSVTAFFPVAETRAFARGYFGGGS